MPSTETDTVINELRSIATGLDRAQTLFAAVDHESENVANRAMAVGFNAIAAGMNQVREAIKEVRTQLSRINDTINQASTSVAAAPREMSPQQVISVLSPATDSVNDAQNGIVAALGRVDEIQNLVRRFLDGGNLGPMLTMLNNIQQVLAGERKRAQDARQHLSAAVNEARQLGESGN
ncbi:hypothetical protein EDC02_7638 [Micromonospora sp. Llam0]|uniref:DUF6244 family protein n=1 Tax=Micromonospora sp. Llam0 TaxID=2485143 RepID=UPI000F473850|nr:DUF6244 family protein [Micromonospora sp. Llam0]ROO52698.1 hypothetical protein EDC02_7638 [Micromonospora sp. Llam0]